ncbi:TetR/AcrR family transcriptional regulator [Rivularia sp. UHCC 0363]|uniref:TetR/AcrR family transcriptional regulator n=1 Tax=Rivularia sp. UHCC 0363 TaxID=3110244 RepID=UPI002B20A06F|nr:TetR/AcrR family transcriptional regulator [Rivularia sp. UHCC 0363]MEA5595116.1 TetR/AcrR family transcriptional regulator [Rivularia sp. UHCC 0363]
MGRPTKENSLTPQDVIEAAIACLDKEGESALGVNRVARELGIKPPAIYKHLNGNAELRKAVVLRIWRQFLAYCREKTQKINELPQLFKAGGMAARNFAKLYPARYKVMMQYQLHPTDADASAVIREALSLFQKGIQGYDLSKNQLIDAMRMVNAATYGFISIEQSGMMTFERSTDASYEIMLDALIFAIAHIRNRE